jgi:Trk K+ transport system NAD-binding subunit
MKLISDLLIYLRFLRFLLWEFRWSLGVFWGLVLLGGLGLSRLYHEKDLAYPEACYHVFTLAFLQANLEFPKEWYLQPFFFLVPMVGLGAVADSLVRLGYLVFARKQNLPEWQRMRSSLYRQHIVVVGVGKVGYRILRELLALGEKVVGIDLRTESEFLEEVRALGVTIIAGNGRHQKTLADAGVAQARAIILATDDDLANLDGALTAREINPKIRVVLRLFDDTLAAKCAGFFAMPAISIAHVAAPAFVATATGRKVYHVFQLDGSQLHLTDLTITPEGSLAGQAVGKVQTEHAVNIIMHRGSQSLLVNPAHDVLLGPGDTVLVIAAMEHLVKLEAANHQQAAMATHRPSS